MGGGSAILTFQEAVDKALANLDPEKNRSDLSEWGPEVPNLRLRAGTGYAILALALALHEPPGQ